jgi:hypothetical protein
MKKNIGTGDRLLRLAFAILILIYAIVEKSILAGVVSLFVFFEVATSWCVLYQLIGKNSCKR